MLRVIVAALGLAGISAAIAATPAYRPEPPPATKRQDCIGACGVARLHCARAKFTAQRGCGVSFNACRARCQSRSP
jgi:hypothetical protein